ncbi:MAG TPA: hypothetical protein VE287_08980, partial [Actinopolymorphaceae bacterium]|nr:hypothetical protein [Actinopolymorphaceae bacterium]
FVAWMAPRGIVAAATASAFAPGLVQDGVRGASDILPATFLVIVATVALYGLTAIPVARLLGVLRSARTRPFLVGGAPWVVDLGRALRDAGLDVLAWAGREDERSAIRAAGLELSGGELLAAAAGRKAEMEGVNAVFLLTEEDDFNAVAANLLRGTVDGPVYRVAASRESQALVAPFVGGPPLFSVDLDRGTIARRHRAGAAIESRRRADGVPAGYDLLLVVRSNGRLDAVTQDERPTPATGDVLVLLGPDGRITPSG